MERTFYSNKCLDEGSLGAMIVSLEYVNSTKQYLHRYAIFFFFEIFSSLISKIPLDDWIALFVILDD